MKPTSLAIVVYLVFLLTQPCQDVFANASEIKSGDRMVAAIGETTETENQSDECSPFCICSCCSISAAYHSFVTVSSVRRSAELHRTLAVDYLGLNTKSFSGSIWQPPKA
jgi:hypothetical protein